MQPPKRPSRPQSAPAGQEQPARPRTPPQQQTLLAKAANDWELADASAIKALQSGTATPDQQKRGLEWILKKACALPEWPYVPGDADQTHMHLGRHLVGHMIMKLLQVDLAKLRRTDPRADPHEPKS